MNGISRGVPSFTRILAFGAYHAARVVDNHEVCALIDSSDEWIRARSGIRTRRFADDAETIPAMAARAGSKALITAGISPAEVSCVVLASMSYLHQAPPAAAVCAAEMGAGNAAAFDIGAACAGFSHALAVSNGLIATGGATLSIHAIAAPRSFSATARGQPSLALPPNPASAPSPGGWQLSIWTPSVRRVPSPISAGCRPPTGRT
jgi:3-hydroxy-3-methylglutaryl CoA synthase